MKKKRISFTVKFVFSSAYQFTERLLWRSNDSSLRIRHWICGVKIYNVYNHIWFLLVSLRDYHSYFITEEANQSRIHGKSNAAGNFVSMILNVHLNSFFFIRVPHQFSAAKFLRFTFCEKFSNKREQKIPNLVYNTTWMWIIEKSRLLCSMELNLIRHVSSDKTVSIGILSNSSCNNHWFTWKMCHV